MESPTTRNQSGPSNTETIRKASAQESYPRPTAAQSYGVVLGCPRSGTTYVARLLKTIPEFESVVGTILPAAVPHVVNQELPTDVYQALAIGFERALDAYIHSGRYHSRARALQKWVHAPSGLRELWRALRGQPSFPEMLIYKEPFLALAPEFVLDALPDGRILHICRDGRDCANSLVESYDVLTDERLRHLGGTEMRIGRRYDDRFVPWWVAEEDQDRFMRSSPYVRAIYMWKYMVRRCHEAFTVARVKDSDRVLVLRYEDLVRDPHSHGPALIGHFGGRPSSQLQTLLDNAHTDSIGAHKNRDPSEVAAAERVASDELSLYGYETS